jgi:L-ribulokinase
LFEIFKTSLICVILKQLPVMNESYVIGVDFGTDSVRSIIVNTANGEEVISSIFNYPRWKAGLYCNAAEQRFRQHPQDYVEGLERTITSCLEKAAPGVRDNVRAISVDTTGSSPVAVNRAGIPLALLPEFEKNPNAMFVLWKDHTSVREAEDINAHNAKSSEDYLRFVGGIYSSEWFWAKLLHILRVDKKVAAACYSWVEHCDWIPFLLTGGKDVHDMKRSVCAAGHKAIWSEAFGGLPPNEFFSTLDPLLEGFTGRLFTKTYTSDKPAGMIGADWAKRLGLNSDVIIGVGAFDAHMGAVGGQIEPYHLSKVMGTSTCDMLVAPVSDIGDKEIKGICGQVNGSIIPGMIGMEAGQSAFGDAYAWFRNLIAWPLQVIANTDATTLSSIEDKIIPELSRQASALPVDESAELALDWMNGRRTPDANQLLKGGFIGLELASDAPRMFRALAEATCFGAKKIVDRFNAEGVPVKGLIGVGGVARKSPFIMQMMADVMNMPIRIHRSEQPCAAGAAMFAATAAGIYPNVEAAMKAMGTGFDMEYRPNQSKVDIYARRYTRYASFGEYVEKHTVSIKNKQELTNE